MLSITVGELYRSEISETWELSEGRLYPYLCLHLRTALQICFNMDPPLYIFLRLIALSYSNFDFVTPLTPTYNHNANY